MLDEGVGIKHLVLVGGGERVQLHARAHSGQEDVYGRARRQAAQVHEVLPVVGCGRERRRERIDPGGARAHVLHPIVGHARSLREVDLDRGINEVRIALDADMPLDEIKPRARCHLHEKPRVGCGAGGIRARNKQYLNATRLCGAGGDVEHCGVIGEGVIQERKTRIDRLHLRLRRGRVSGFATAGDAR